MISLPPKGNEAKVLGSNFAALKAEPQVVPNMTVKVSAGTFWTSANEHQEFSGGTSPTFYAPPSQAKWVLLTVTTAGALNTVDGDVSNNPRLPDASLYKDELPIAAVFLDSTDTVITSEMVFDVRPMWMIPPDSVDQSQLDNFATITYVDNEVATKADKTGTPEPDFWLNVGAGTINYAGLWVDRNLNPDVAIRFNEAGSPAFWEFTNDGSTWYPIAAGGVGYYTAAELDNGALDNRYLTIADEGSPSTRGAPFDHTHLWADITDAAAAATLTEVGYLTGVNSDIQPQLDNKVARDAHTTMVTGINVTFVGGGEVLGLPATPSATGAASKEYVDATAGALATHIADDTVHLTTDQNTFLDGLVLGGSPASLQAADVNALIGITGNVQNQIDTHTHTASDVTDFDTAVGTYVSGTMLLSDVSDVDAAVSGEILQYNGATWNNVAFLTIAGTDFVRKTGSIAESITGVKTFNDNANFGANVVVTGDLTVNGTTTTIDATNLEVSDKNIMVNAGYIGPAIGSSGSGLHVDRGFGGSPVTDYAVLTWDETAQRWQGGIVGSETSFAVEGQTRNQPFYELHAAGSPVTGIYNLGFDVPMPLAGTAALQVFVNGVKQVEGAAKSYQVTYGGSPVAVTVTFNGGSEPPVGADVEFYGFGYIG